MFTFSVTNGVLEPNEKRLVQVGFRPQHPIIYYKRVICLVQNHVCIGVDKMKWSHYLSIIKFLFFLILFLKIALAIDLIGSSSSELIQPPELGQKNVALFNYLRRNDLLNNPPEVIVK